MYSTKDILRVRIRSARGAIDSLETLLKRLAGRLTLEQQSLGYKRLLELEKVEQELKAQLVMVENASLAAALNPPDIVSPVRRPEEVN